MKDSIKFAIFVALFNGIYRGVLCLMRHILLKVFRKRDEKLSQEDLHKKVNRFASPVAGFLSALTLVLDAKNRRNLIAMLAMSRMIETSIKLGQSGGYICESPYTILVLWLFSNLATQYALSCNKSILNKGVAKFYTHWA